MENDKEAQLSIYAEDSESKPEIHTSEIQKHTTENVDEVDNIQSGYDNLESSAFTKKEYVEAEGLQLDILNNVRAFMRIGVEIAEKVYDFKRKELFERLGYDSFHDWCIAVGLPKSTLNKYIATFEALTIRMKIKREEYENLDIGKVREIAKLVKITDNKKIFRDSLEISTDLSSGDFKEYLKETITDLQINNGVLNTSDIISEEIIRPKIPTKNVLGLFNISESSVKIKNPSETIIKNEMSEVDGVNLTLYYNPTNKKYFVHINDDKIYEK